MIHEHCRWHAHSYQKCNIHSTPARTDELAHQRFSTRILLTRRWHWRTMNEPCVSKDHLNKQMWSLNCLKLCKYFRNICAALVPFHSHTLSPNSIKTARDSRLDIIQHPKLHHINMRFLLITILFALVSRRRRRRPLSGRVCESCVY